MNRTQALLAKWTWARGATDSVHASFVIWILYRAVFARFVIIFRWMNVVVYNLTL